MSFSEEVGRAVLWEKWVVLWEIWWVVLWEIWWVVFRERWWVVLWERWVVLWGGWVVLCDRWVVLLAEVGRSLGEVVGRSLRKVGRVIL